MAETDHTSEERQKRSVSGKPKIITALGHSCGLAAFLGIFIALSAYTSDPNSGMLRIGIMVTLVGIAGFIAARWVGRRHR